ncbi:DHHC palmitoyltransferase-domain-containing protein [Glomus cerebriforme]|uniref:Palmitoyltransferase n=1 Tax=Glomus cerebriforme TaxID=658196 RepID=A0A397TLE5_9GLOM|nr:DHHC palmitoyltransferase-domain-containing protein [Glomus cerebriforme]
MNNQARASRHASGILPSKQFFAPRKPITHNASLRRKSSVVGNSLNTPPSPGSTFTSAIGPQLLNFSSEEEASLLHQSSSLALATFSAHSSPIINNPSLDQSVDTIFNSDASVVNRNSTPVRPPSALLLRRQQRQQSGEGGSTELSQAVIDSVMEPITPVPVLEPSSYRQLMRQATINTGSDLSSRDFAAATAYSRHSDVSPNTPSSNTKLTMMSSKILNASSPTKQPTFNPYALIKMPRIISPHSLSSTDYKGQKRLYQVWPGRNRFFLGGRIMTSRDFPAFLVAFSALVVPSGLFMGFTCPFLFQNVSPAVVFIFVYLFLLAVTSMLRTSWSDPGIIPRDLDPSPPTEYIEDLENSQNNTNLAYEQARSFPLPKEVKINGQTVRLKYCETCKIYRPPRCSHCRQCDNCVENEDHHCIWLNNCIGRRNYRTFFTFIATATILCVYVLGFCLAHLLLLMKQGSHNFFEAIMKAPVRYPFVCGLTGYHMYLISNNLTTHEQIRVPIARRNGNRNPFDFRNVGKNCLWVLCRPMSRSSVSRRAYVDNENLQEENGVGNTFNGGVRSTVIAGEIDTGEIDNNALGEGDIRVDIKEVITFNNGDDLNELQPQQNENNNIKEDTKQVSSSFEPTVPSIETDENSSVPVAKEQIKELQITEPMVTTET